MFEYGIYSTLETLAEWHRWSGGKYRMVRWRLTELMEEYRAKTGEPLLMRHLALATGLANSTVYHLVERNPKRVSLATIDLLLKFFKKELDQVTVSDLIEFEDAPDL